MRIRRRRQRGHGYHRRRDPRLRPDRGRGRCHCRWKTRGGPQIAYIACGRGRRSRADVCYLLIRSWCEIRVKTLAHHLGERPPRRDRKNERTRSARLPCGLAVRDNRAFGACSGVRYRWSLTSGYVEKGKWLAAFARTTGGDLWYIPTSTYIYRTKLRLLTGLAQAL